jgi:hypothetical protein
MSNAHKKQNAAKVLGHARRAWRTAVLGLEDFRSDDPDRRWLGYCNVIVWGRAVTNVLQNMKAVDERKFDEWYRPHVKAMRDDQLVRWCYEQREKVLKQIAPDLIREHSVSFSEPEDFEVIFSQRPEGSRENLSFDPSGKPGFRIRQQDGQIAWRYVDLTRFKGRISSILRFPKSPTMHLGKELTDRSLDTILKCYLDYLDALLGEAESMFGEV